MSVLDPVLAQISKLWARIDGMPTVRWGTVTQAWPLRVRLDGDTDPLPFTPSTTVRGLAVDRRVVCVEQNRRVTVVSGGVVTPWAQAVGEYASPGNSGGSPPVYWDAGVTVALPPGRFSVPPNIVLTAGRGGQVLGASILTRSVSSFTARTIRFGEEVEAGTVVFWQAVQMNQDRSNG